MFLPQRGINIIGLNTRSNRESSIPNYEYNYVKCKCSEWTETLICKDLEQHAGARNITVGLYYLIAF